MLELLIGHLKKHGNITSWEAITEYGCTRLSHYIWIMRTRLGMNIESEVIIAKNRFGKPTHYCKYILKED